MWISSNTKTLTITFGFDLLIAKAKFEIVEVTY